MTMSEPGGPLAPSEEQGKQNNVCSVVAIGASAGGLEALKEVVAHLGVGIPLAYVVVQHLSPSHTSLLSTLLSRETELPVTTIVDGLNVEPGVIYVTPPNADVIYQAGLLRLFPPSSPTGPKPSIDRFLNTLAQQLGQQCIAIILSGTGSDGAIGCVAVKAAGGAVIIQEPSTAKYDSMPQAVANKGFPLIRMSPTDIGKLLGTPQSNLAAQYNLMDSLSDKSRSDILGFINVSVHELVTRDEAATSFQFSEWEAVP